MPRQQRSKTDYPGVYYVEADAIGRTGKEKIYYIQYRRPGSRRLIEEKVGRQYAEDMTAAKANRIRSSRIEGATNNQERRDSIQEAKAVESGRWTIAKLWEFYKESKPNLKGLVTDENRFKNYIKPSFGEKTPVEIIPLDIERLKYALQKKLKPATVRNVLELFRRIINFGVEKQLCAGLPFSLKLPGKLDNEKTEDLTPEQMIALFQVLEDEPNLAAANMMRLALFTGMRRGEMFKLQWNDIDFHRGFIVIKGPKGGKTQQIPLNDAARTLLQNHPRNDSSPFVFPGRNGAQRQDISKSIRAIKRRAGLPDDFRGLHGLRHTYASMLANSGQVDLYTLQKLLTHKSPQMTLRYAHLRDDALRRAADITDEIVSSVLANVTVAMTK